MLLNPSVTCAGCKACYIDETKRHFTNRTEEHLGKNKKSLSTSLRESTMSRKS